MIEIVRLHLFSLTVHEDTQILDYVFPGVRLRKSELLLLPACTTP